MNRGRPPPLTAHLGTSTSSPYSSEDFRCGTTSCSSSPSGIWSSPTADLGRSHGSIPSPLPTSSHFGCDAPETPGWVHSPLVSSMRSNGASPTAADLLSFPPFHSPTCRLPGTALGASSPFFGEAANGTYAPESCLPDLDRDLGASSSPVSPRSNGEALPVFISHSSSCLDGKSDVPIPVSGVGHPHFAASYAGPSGPPLDSEDSLVSHGHCAGQESPSELISPVLRETFSLQQICPGPESSGLFPSPGGSRLATVTFASPPAASVPSPFLRGHPNRQDVESAFLVKEEPQRRFACPMRHEQLHDPKDTPQDSSVSFLEVRNSFPQQLASEVVHTVSAPKTPGWSSRLPDRKKFFLSSQSTEAHGPSVITCNEPTEVNRFFHPLFRSDCLTVSEKPRPLAGPCELSSSGSAKGGGFNQQPNTSVEASASLPASSFVSLPHEAGRLSTTHVVASSFRSHSSRLMPVHPIASSPRLQPTQGVSSSKYFGGSLPACMGYWHTPQASGQSPFFSSSERKTTALQVPSTRVASSSPLRDRLNRSQLYPEAALWSPLSSPCPADESAACLSPPSSFLLSHRAFKKASYRLSAVALDGVQLSCPVENDQKEAGIAADQSRTELPPPASAFSSVSSLRGPLPKTEPSCTQPSRCAPFEEKIRLSSDPRVFAYEDISENRGRGGSRTGSISFRMNTPSTPIIAQPTVGFPSFPACRAWNQVSSQREACREACPTGGDEAREKEQERDTRENEGRERRRGGDDNSEDLFAVVHHSPDKRPLQEMRKDAATETLENECENADQNARGQHRLDTRTTQPDCFMLSGRNKREETDLKAGKASAALTFPDWAAETSQVEKDRQPTRKSPFPASRRLVHADLDWSRSRDIGRGRSARVCVVPHKSSGRLVAIKEVHVGCFGLYRGLDDVTKRNRYQLACEVKTHRMISYCSDMAALSFLHPCRSSPRPVSATTQFNLQSPSPLSAPSSLPLSASFGAPSDTLVSPAAPPSSGSSSTSPHGSSLSTTASASPPRAGTSPSSSHGRPSHPRLLPLSASHCSSSSSSSSSSCTSSILFPRLSSSSTSRCGSEARASQSCVDSVPSPSQPSSYSREESSTCSEAPSVSFFSSFPASSCPSFASLPLEGNCSRPVSAGSSPVRLSSLCFLPFSSVSLSPSKPKALHVSCSPLDSPFLSSSPASAISSSLFPLTPSTMCSTSLLTPTPQKADPPTLSPSWSSSTLLVPTTSSGSGVSGFVPATPSLLSPLGPAATLLFSTATAPPHRRMSDANDSSESLDVVSAASVCASSSSLSCGVSATECGTGTESQRLNSTALTLSSPSRGSPPLDPPHLPSCPLLPEGGLAALPRLRSSSACPFSSGGSVGEACLRESLKLPSARPPGLSVPSSCVACPLSCFLLPFLGAYRWQSNRGGCVHVAVEYMHYGTLGDLAKALRLLRVLQCLNLSKEGANESPISLESVSTSNRSLAEGVCFSSPAFVSGDGEPRAEDRGPGEQRAEEGEEEERTRGREMWRESDERGEKEGGAKEERKNAATDESEDTGITSSHITREKSIPTSSRSYRSTLGSLAEPRLEVARREEGDNVGREKMMLENTGDFIQRWLPAEWKEERQRKWTKRKRKMQTAVLVPEATPFDADHIEIPESILKLIAFQILGALSFLHRHRCIHRDVKPQNILINNEGIVKVGDFGISRFLDVDRNEWLTFVGTELYMSPERLHHHFSAVHLTTSSRRRSKASHASRRQVSPTRHRHSISSFPSSTSCPPSRDCLPRNGQASREKDSACRRRDLATEAEQGGRSPPESQTFNCLSREDGTRGEGTADDMGGNAGDELLSQKTTGSEANREYRVAKGEEPRKKENHRENAFLSDGVEPGKAQRAESEERPAVEEGRRRNREELESLAVARNEAADRNAPFHLRASEATSRMPPTSVRQRNPPTAGRTEVPSLLSPPAIEDRPERANIRGKREEKDRSKKKERSRRKEIFDAMEKEEKRVGAYSFPSDIWSVGVLLFELAASHHPFPEGLPCDLRDCNVVSLLQNHFQGSKRRKRRSYEFRDFLFNCMRVKPGKRATADSLLLHPWLLEGMASRQYFKRWIVKVYRRASLVQHFLAEAEGIVAAGGDQEAEVRSGVSGTERRGEKGEYTSEETGA
ncbi:UNVERIFIED_CONTAM: protein kinase (incomplete catalytic triad) [Hammondia hammondi]|eukprot:XP_008887867.1 protein kinase (incomplete catalytic triad) [Hammondia hammondi]